MSSTLSCFVSLCQCVEGHSFEKEKLELALLVSFNRLLSSQRSHPRQDNTIDGSYDEIVLYMNPQTP